MSFKGFPETGQLRPFTWWSKLAQVVRNFRAAPIHSPDKLATDHSITIDHVCLRPAKRTVERTGFLRPIANRDQVDFIVLQKFVIRVVVGVDADSDYDNPFVLQPLLHLNQRRSLLDARRTKSSPEIQHHHLPAKLAKRHFGVGILHGEVRRIRADSSRIAPAVASDQGGYESNSQKRGMERLSHPAIIANN